MMFCFKSYRYIFFGFVFIGYLVSSYVLQASAFISPEEEIDAAMIRLGQSQEKFQNVGALFKVETEFSGFEPRLTYVGNVCYLEEQRCIGIANAEYDESQKYRVGFKLNDGKLFYHDIIAVKIILKKDNECDAREDSSSLHGLADQLLRRTGCVMEIDLAVKPSYLRRIECCVLPMANSEGERSITVGFDIKSCSPFIFDGMRRAFPTKLHEINVLREQKIVTCFNFEYCPLDLEQVSGEVVTRQALSYKKILDERGLSGFIFDYDGRLMGMYSYSLQSYVQTVVNSFFDLIDSAQHFHTSEPSRLLKAYFLMHIDVLLKMEREDPEADSI
jgi:hypothetical protein